MKDYKRLTEKRETPLVMSMWADSSYSLAIHNRLAELEDKIESGEIDYVANKDKLIARLTAENERLREEVNRLSHENDELEYKTKMLEVENAELRATISKMETVEKELRARLENAVELPCKVGDKVYWVEDDPNTLGICEFTVQGFSFRTDDDSGLRAILEAFLEPCIDYYKNKNLFFDRAAAEKRLAELRGGTDEHL